jgi:hypothetical protein
MTNYNIDDNIYQNQRYTLILRSPGNWTAILRRGFRQHIQAVQFANHAKESATADKRRAASEAEKQALEQAA